MKELKFVFKRNLSNFYLYKVKESFDDTWYLVPDDAKDVTDLPNYIQANK